MNNYPTNWTTQKKNKQVSGNSPPKLNQEETFKLNRPITTSKIKYVKKGERKKTKNKQTKKSPCRQMSRTRWLHWGILPNIQTRTYTDPSQTPPRD